MLFKIVVLFGFSVLVAHAGSDSLESQVRSILTPPQTREQRIELSKVREELDSKERQLTKLEREQTEPPFALAEKRRVVAEIRRHRETLEQTPSVEAEKVLQEVRESVLQMPLIRELLLDLKEGDRVVPLSKLRRAARTLGANQAQQIDFLSEFMDPNGTSKKMSAEARSELIVSTVKAILRNEYALSNLVEICARKSHPMTKPVGLTVFTMSSILQLFANYSLVQNGTIPNAAGIYWAVATIVLAPVSAILIPDDVGGDDGEDENLPGTMIGLMGLPASLLATVPAYVLESQLRSNKYYHKLLAPLLTRPYLAALGDRSKQLKPLIQRVLAASKDGFCEDAFLP